MKGEIKKNIDVNREIELLCSQIKETYSDFQNRYNESLPPAPEDLRSVLNLMKNNLAMMIPYAEAYKYTSDIHSYGLETAPPTTFTCKLLDEINAHGHEINDLDFLRKMVSGATDDELRDFILLLLIAGSEITKKHIHNYLHDCFYTGIGKQERRDWDIDCEFNRIANSGDLIRRFGKIEDKRIRNDVLGNIKTKALLIKSLLLYSGKSNTAANTITRLYLEQNAPELFFSIQKGEACAWGKNQWKSFLLLNNEDKALFEEWYLNDESEKGEKITQ